MKIYAIAAGVIIATSTIFLYAQQSHTPPEQPPTVNTKTPPSSAWNHFEDDQRGFSFDYPPTWKVREPTCSSLCPDPTKVLQADSNDPGLHGGDMSMPYLSRVFITFPIDNTPEARKSIQENNKLFAQDAAHELVSLDGRKVAWIIEDKTSEKHQEEIARIVESFKFISE